MFALKIFSSSWKICTICLVKDTILIWNLKIKKNYMFDDSNSIFNNWNSRRINLNSNKNWDSRHELKSGEKFSFGKTVL